MKIGCFLQVQVVAFLSREGDEVKSIVVKLCDEGLIEVVHFPASRGTAFPRIALWGRPVAADMLIGI